MTNKRRSRMKGKEERKKKECKFQTNNQAHGEISTHGPGLLSSVRTNSRLEKKTREVGDRAFLRWGMGNDINRSGRMDQLVSVIDARMIGK